jgi:hypothetical protein
MPGRTTNIEQLMDLSEIFDKPSNSSKGMQSMEGFPTPPHMNSSYNDQMMQENTERHRQQTSMQGKIRQSSDMRRAMNAGRDPSEPMMIASHFNQRGDIIPYVPQQKKYRYEELEEDEDTDYEMGPKVGGSHFSPQSFSSSSPISCMDIARHIKSCPICSKLYENDKSVYIIGIVFLLVVCIILLKKVIENVK